MTAPYAPLGGERELDRLMAGLEPELDPVRYAFCRRPDAILPAGLPILCLFHEAEGVTLILDAARAERLGFVADFLARRIVLKVHSDLLAVGFLARISAALTLAGIPCNVVSAAYHDHLFVPEADAERALALLQSLQLQAQREGKDSGSEVVYAVTVRVDAAAAEEWLAWMQQVHVPAVLATGCFRDCLIQRTVDGSTAADRVAFVLEYQSPSLERLLEYQQDHAPALQHAHSSRYAGRFDATRSIRAVIGRIPPTR